MIIKVEFEIDTESDHDVQMIEEAIEKLKALMETLK